MEISYAKGNSGYRITTSNEHRQDLPVAIRHILNDFKAAINSGHTLLTIFSAYNDVPLSSTTLRRWNLIESVWQLCIVVGLAIQDDKRQWVQEFKKALSEAASDARDSMRSLAHSAFASGLITGSDGSSADSRKAYVDRFADEGLKEHEYALQAVILNLNRCNFCMHTKHLG